MGFFSRIFGGRPRVLPTHVEDSAGFEKEVLRAELPVVVDVWGPDCAPCRMLEPVIIEVATRYEGKVKVVELSSAAEPRLLERLQVMATPTILVYRGGQELGRITGYRPQSWFDEMIATELLPAADA